VVASVSSTVREELPSEMTRRAIDPTRKRIVLV